MWVGAFPKHLAGAIVHRHQQRLPARREDQPIARLVDQRTLARIPGRHGGVIFQHQIHYPAWLPGLGIPADHVTFRSQGDHTPAGHRRNGARHAVIGRHQHAIGVAPNLQAVVERQTAQHVGRTVDLVDPAVFQGRQKQLGIVFQPIVQQLCQGCILLGRKLPSGLAGSAGLAAGHKEPRKHTFDQCGARASTLLGFAADSVRARGVPGRRAGTSAGFSVGVARSVLGGRLRVVCVFLTSQGRSQRSGKRLSLLGGNPAQHLCSLVAQMIEYIDPTARYRSRSIAFAKLDLPEARRTFGRPTAGQTRRIVVDRIVLRTAKPWPSSAERGRLSRPEDRLAGLWRFGFWTRRRFDRGTTTNRLREIHARHPGGNQLHRFHARPQYQRQEAHQTQAGGQDPFDQPGGRLEAHQ